MQLRRIEVRSFRKLSHRIVEGLGDGLNVIVGDNEAGKSTLLAALRTVLFERHRVGGAVLKAMLPHGAPAARPEITLDFAIEGVGFRLRKAFNQQPQAELVLPGGQIIVGDAVEERMAVLLGFQPPGSRGSKPDEHQGVYGLLWVDQGVAHAPMRAGGGREALAAALESEVGTVTGGERGRRLLERAAERHDTFWDKRDKPRGVLKQAQEDVAALEREQAKLAHRLGQHETQVATLAAAEDALALYQREARLEVATRAADLARAAARQVEQLASAVRELESAATRARSDRDAAGERARARQSLMDKSAATAVAAERTEAARADATEAQATSAAAAKTAAARLDTVRTRRGAIDARLASLEQVLAACDARDRLTRLQEQLAAAQVAADHRCAAERAAADPSPSPANLAALDRRCAARDAALSGLQAASVEIIAEPGGPAFTAEGVLHRAGEPLRLARDAVLDLPGFGRLHIRPGGGVAALASAAAEAEAAVAADLRRLGCASRDDVAEAVSRHAAAIAEVGTQARLFAHYAPKGLDALRRELDALGPLAALPDIERPPDAAAARVRLREQRAERQADEAAADADCRRLDAVREQADRTAAVLAERHAAALRDREAALHGLVAARAAVPDDRLAQDLAEAGRAAALASEAQRVASAALAAADPDAAALALRQAETVEHQVRADITALRQRKLVLEVELRTLGRDGDGEQRAAVNGRLGRARQHLKAQSLEAAASRLLRDTLLAAQQDSKARWFGPVRDRVGPYLQLIQPGAELQLDDTTFAIETVMRDGVPEPFDTLSVGAREQVAVITRLALGDILRDAGQPSAIVLDDALVNTDETRIAGMQAILRKAAATQQVVILTCRERDFADLGAPVHRL